jgi:hypothetical protein
MAPSGSGCPGRGPSPRHNLPDSDAQRPKSQGHSGVIRAVLGEIRRRQPHDDQRSHRQRDGGRGEADDALEPRPAAEQLALAI